MPVESAVTLPCQATSSPVPDDPLLLEDAEAGAERLAALDSLTTRISFRVHIFRKLP